MTQIKIKLYDKKENRIKTVGKDIFTLINFEDIAQYAKTPLLTELKDAYTNKPNDYKLVKGMLNSINVHNVGDFLGGEFIPTGIIHYDFDNLTNDEIESIINSLEGCNAYMVSPSGAGLKVFYSFENLNQKNFKKVYESFGTQLGIYLNDKLSTDKYSYGIGIDKSCNDFNRLCYIGMNFTMINDLRDCKNANDYYTEETKRVKTITPTSTDNNESIVDYTYNVCSQNKINPCNGYQNWLQLCYLLKYIYKENLQGLEWFVKYSKLDKGFVSEEACKAKWDSITSYSDYAGIGSFIMRFKESGVDYKPLKLLSEFVYNESLKSLTYSNYEFYKDDLSKKYYYKKKGNETWKLFNRDEVLNTFEVEFETKMGRRINPHDILKLIINNQTPIVNPIKELLSNRTWDGKSRIDEIINVVPVKEKEEFKYHFTKWYLNMIHTAYTNNYCNPVALVLVGEQSSGKTYFFENILPVTFLKKNLVEISEKFDPSNKDHQHQMCYKLLIVLDEMSSYDKGDMNVLKAILTKKDFDIRLSYRADGEQFKRYASFAGTTNNADFLKDYTGDRRYSVFQLEGDIDHAYDKIDKEQLLAEMLHLYNNGFDFTFTQNDFKTIIEKNRENFTYESAEEEVIKMFCKKVTGNNWLTFTDIEAKLSSYKIAFKLQKATFGKLVSKLGFESVRKKVNGKLIMYYNIEVNEEALKNHLYNNHNGIDGFAEAEYGKSRLF